MKFSDQMNIFPLDMKYLFIQCIHPCLYPFSFIKYLMGYLRIFSVIVKVSRNREYFISP